MRILFLTNDLDVTKGWGRYSVGFLAQARTRNGAADVVAPDPSRLRSKVIRSHQSFTALLDAWKLRKEARGAEVIHAATEPVAPLAFFLSLLARVPYVVSVHGTYGDLSVYRPEIRWLYRLAFLRATRIVAVSGYTADVIRRQFPRAKIDVIPGGFSPADHPSKKEGMNAERRILAVGAFKPRKGFHTLVEALGLLKKKRIVFRADIVGPKNDVRASDPGERRTYFELVDARAAELGLVGQVTFHGRVPEEALRRFYADADLFVLPSEHEGAAFEGLGLVYLEAMAYGVPVIGCLDSGAIDVIRDGVNGSLVPPGDPVKLAAAMERILGDAAYWKRMSDAAPSSIGRFRWETVGADMEATYSKAISDYAR